MGVIAAAAIGAVGAGAAGGLGVLSSSKAASAAKSAMHREQRISEAQSATAKMYSDQVRADYELAQQGLANSEQAAFNVFQSLGQPGTYDTPSLGITGGGPIGLGLINDPQASTGSGGSSNSVLSGGYTATKSGVVTGQDVSYGMARWAGSRPWESKMQLTDPNALTSAIQSESAFRSVSKMVAESEQLMNRSGPLWNQLNNSIVGGVYESSAAMNRQMMEQLARSMSRGGAARRVGYEQAVAFNVQESINQQRAQSLWQSKAQLEQWRATYVPQAISFAQSWVQNHAGIRDAFTSAMTNLRTFWAQTMAPAMIGANAQQGAQAMASNAALQSALASAAQTKMSGIASAVGGLTSALSSAFSSGMTNSGVNTGQTSGMSAFLNAGGSLPWKNPDTGQWVGGNMPK